MFMFSNLEPVRVYRFTCVTHEVLSYVEIDLERLDYFLYKNKLSDSSHNVGFREDTASWLTIEYEF